MVLQYIETDGGTLAVEVEGNGRLVVCAPGMGDARDAYAPLAAQLVSRGYTVARVDPRGHGDSTPNFNHYGDAAMADDFLTVVEQLGKGPAVLAGASFSAGAAVIAAGKRPDLVAGIILHGPFLRNPASPLVLSLMQVLFWRPWGPFVWKMYTATLWPGLGDKASERAAALTSSLTRPGHWAAFQATVAGADHSVVEPWIKKVKAPALVVMGEKDPDWSDAKKEAEWVASNFSEVETIMVPDAGHAPMFERPEMVGEKVLHYLENLARAGFR